MNDQRNHEIVLVMIILGAFVCLLMVNEVLQRIIEKPFLNNVNHRNERFNSPHNIIFLTSAVILVLGSIIKCLKNSKNSPNLQQKNSTQNNQSQYYQTENQNKTQKSQNDIIGQKTQLIYHLKTSLPKFVELSCFMYGINWLGFAKMLFLTALIKFVLSLIYEAIFTNRQYRCFKIIFCVLACCAFVCFNIFENPIKRTSTQAQIIYGYLFAIGIGISVISRKLLKPNPQQIPIPIIDTIIHQSKLNLTLSFLMIFSLQQQIYGPVFSILHLQFMIDIFLLGGLLLIGLLLKTICRRQFSWQLTEFMVVLQKCITVFIALTYSPVEVGVMNTLAITLVAVVALGNLYLQLNSHMMKGKVSTSAQKVSIMEQIVENASFNVDDRRDQINNNVL